MKAIGWLLAMCLGVGCSRDAAETDGTEHVVKPAVPEPPAAAPGSGAVPEQVPDGVEPPAAAGERLAAAQPPSTAAEPPKAPEPPPAAPKPATPAAEKEQPPAPATPATSPKPPARKTVVPRTDHVRAELGAGLQKLLDADPRMQPWLQRVMGIADDCYAKQRKAQPGAAGVIRVRITMHDSARPTPDIQSLPAALSGLVACATGPLTRARMPLFTGPEGEKHGFAIHFTP